MKRLFSILVGITIIVLLSASAWIVFRLLTKQGPIEVGAINGPLFSEESPGGVNQVSLNVSFIPAADLPERPADVTGAFLRQEDKSYFVGTGFFDIRGDGEGGYITEHDGPAVEVVTGQDTVFYKDVSDTQTHQQSISADLLVQQVVKHVSSPDPMPYPSFVSIWGVQRGDRIYADVFVYRDRP